MYQPTTFFWVAQLANLWTVVVSLAALLIVVWLGPRRRTNISFAVLLCAVIVWMGGSFIARLQVNIPVLGNAQPMLNLLSFGFAAIGITLFWFVESFERTSRPWFWAVNAVAGVVYGLFLVLLLQDRVISNPHRASNGGLQFTISSTGTLLSAFHYIFDGLAIVTLLRQRMWRQRWHLLIGVGILVATSVIALLDPGIPIQTYMVAFGMVFMTYELVKQQLFNPLLQVNQRLEAEVEQRTSALAASLAEQERVQSELAIAREIQLSLLPSTTPQMRCLEIAGTSLPAQEVGGDLFAYHPLGQGRLVVAVGDVSGKGIPAALLMAFSLSTFELLADEHADQGALLTACNRALAPRLLQSSMQTGFLTMLLDAPRRRAYVANAGMITPLLYRGGRVAYIDSYGLPLGAEADTAYHQRTVALEPGDQILIVSDGIVEAMNRGREMWDFARLEQLMARCGGEHPQVLIDAILEDVRQFTADAPPHDDMTLVSLRLVG